MRIGFLFNNLSPQRGTEGEGGSEGGEERVTSDETKIITAFWLRNLINC